MKIECPKCKHNFDVSHKKILEAIERSPTLRKTAASLIGRINRRKAKPENMSRGADAIKPAQEARWKDHKKKPGKDNPQDLNL